ncbi:polysaccharide biosynthesis protein [Cupriavidus basilensis]
MATIFVQKAPAATIATLAQAMLRLFNMPSHPVHVIGTRHGEKLFRETLLSREEMACSVDQGRYFRIPPDMRNVDAMRSMPERGERRCLSQRRP